MSSILGSLWLCLWTFGRRTHLRLTYRVVLDEVLQPRYLVMRHPTKLHSSLPHWHGTEGDFGRQLWTSATKKPILSEKEWAS